MKNITEKEYREVRRNYLDYQLRKEDGGYQNHSYRYEQEMLNLVRTGNVQQIIENQNHQIFPTYPDFVDFNSYKSEEYVAVVSVAMASRAAIAGGLTSIDSFQLCDLYMKRIAACRNLKDLLQIRDEAILAFTKLVKEVQQGSRTLPYIEESKKFILANIFKKISVRDVAEAVNLNAIYLERIFREKEGVTIGQYIRREKIMRAENLLIYSDRSIREIAEYLSFSSQSYFGNIFRKETGLTPKQFRLKHKITGF